MNQRIKEMNDEDLLDYYCNILITGYVSAIKYIDEDLQLVRQELLERMEQIH